MAELSSRMAGENLHLNCCSPLVLRQSASSKRSATARMIRDFAAEFYFLMDDFYEYEELPSIHGGIFNMFHEPPKALMDKAESFLFYLNEALAEAYPKLYSFLRGRFHEVWLDPASYPVRLQRMLSCLARYHGDIPWIALRRISPTLRYYRSYYYLDRWPDIASQCFAVLEQARASMPSLHVLSMDDVLADYCIVNNQELYEIAPFLAFQGQPNPRRFAVDMEHFVSGVFDVIAAMAEALLQGEKPPFATTAAQRQAFLQRCHPRPSHSLEEIEILLCSGDVYRCGQGLAGLFFRLPEDNSELIYRCCHNLPASVRILTMLRYYNKVVKQTARFQEISDIHSTRIDADLADKTNDFRTFYRNMTGKLAVT